MLDSKTGRYGSLVAALWLALLVLAGAAAAEEEKFDGDPDLPWLDNPYYKIHLNVRARIGLADINGFENSEAYTIRTRAGIEIKPLYGFSPFVEGEYTWSIADSQYYDGTGSNNRGQSIIADPENIELNQGYLQWAHEDLLGQELVNSPLGVKARGGRQRIIYDDARWIGNVGWRQNEQTFDAFHGVSNFGIDGLTVQAGYLWDIRRIFGNPGSPRGNKDFSSKSTIVNANYQINDAHDVTGFVYLLDFENDSPVNSSNTYGVRAKGRFGLTEELSLGYVFSYAFQTEAGKNPVDYDAHYGWANLDLKLKEVGSIGVTYEHLGSDDGNAVVQTSLSTAHKFNGFADAFLNNNGTDGLRDLHVTVAPVLPWKFKGKVIYHEFWGDDSGDHAGREIDAVFTRPITKNIYFLSKSAYFMGKNGIGSRWRQTFELNFKY